MTTWRPGPAGPRRWRSGWLPCSTSRHARQVRHGRASSCGRAQQPGRDVEREGRLADPFRADQEDGLGHGPRIIVAAAASAAACPRVRAPSMKLSVRRFGWRRGLARRAPLRCGLGRRRRSRVSVARRRLRGRRLAGRTRLGRSLCRGLVGDAVGRRAPARRGGRRLPRRGAAWREPWPRLSAAAEDAAVLRGARGLRRGRFTALDRGGLGRHADGSPVRAGRPPAG